MRSAYWLTGAGVAVASAGFVTIDGGNAQSAAAGPKARYVMDVSTVSGFMGNPMAAMLGRGSTEQRELTLRLGSALSPTGGVAKADHFMPAGMRLGQSVPLETPQPVVAKPGERDEAKPPEQFRRPKGRLLIFWGCGAHVGPGQPVVIDFAKVAAGQMPPGLFSSNVPVENGPTYANSRTYGHWPNVTTRKKLDRSASLIGDHRVAGNYSPDIAFNLAQDFMAALAAKSNASPDGSTLINWNNVAAATGYYAWVMGGKSMGDDTADMVWWTSAGRQEFGAGLWDWLAPATVNRLITQRVVMPPTQTNCAVPAEVKNAGGGFMIGFLYAYGPEADFAFPPKPANPKLAWRPEWTAKARYRATTTLMLGMPGMGPRGEDDDAKPAQNDRPCKPSLKGMFGKVMGGKGC